MSPPAPFGTNSGFPADGEDIEARGGCRVDQGGGQGQGGGGQGEGVACMGRALISYPTR